MSGTRPEASGLDGPEIRERHLEVPRTARYAVLGGDGSDVRELWLVAHGYRQLARRFLRRFRGLADGSRAVVAPEGLSRFYLDDGGGRHGPEHRVGASWMTREDREAEIRDYVEYLDRLVERVVEELAHAGVRRERLRIRALGFSQGGHTAARWAVEGRTPPAQLVLWGAYLPPDLDPERAARRLGRMELVLVRGEDDRHRDPERADAEAQRLAAWGVAPEILRYAGGHEIAPDALSRLAAL